MLTDSDTSFRFQFVELDLKKSSDTILRKFLPKLKF